MKIELSVEELKDLVKGKGEDELINTLSEPTKQALQERKALKLNDLPWLKFGRMEETQKEKPITVKIHDPELFLSVDDKPVKRGCGRLRKKPVKIGGGRPPKKSVRRNKWTEKKKKRYLKEYKKASKERTVKVLAKKYGITPSSARTLKQIFKRGK